MDLAQVEVYLGDFISTCQVVHYKRTHVVCHLFRTIDTVFLPNESGNLVRKEPILQKKLQQEDAAWYTCKIILGWYLDICRHFLRLLPTR